MSLTVAGTLATVRALHPGFSAVTEAQIEAVWPEALRRSGSDDYGSAGGPAVALMAAHLIAMGPAGTPGSGVGITAASSSSSGLSITMQRAPAAAGMGDLYDTAWGRRWHALTLASPAVSGPRIMM